MSDERSGRELTPRPEEERGAVTPREPALPQPTTTAADRFHAGDAAHTVGLTEERAAGIVRQSGNARFIAFLGALVLVLFIPIYWIYDIGVPFLGVEGRMGAEANQQHVTDVARGHELYLANCARCHGNTGEGGIGPRLNDQGKMYNALTPQGLAGGGHLNPEYLEIVLHTGGRYICGDPASGMPAWIQPEGPLNYREIEEIIAFMLASDEISWIHYDLHPEPGTEPAPPTEYRGWRDPDYTPPPDATPVPACWRGDPWGRTPTPATPAPVESPGTVDVPRVIEILATDMIQWVDPATNERITAITVVQGETIEFRVSNPSVTEHNFHIGSADELSVAPGDSDLPGLSTFTNGEQRFTYTFDDIPDQPQFACTVLGHYASMHGDFLVVTEDGEQPDNGENGDNGASPAPEDE